MWIFPAAAAARRARACVLAASAFAAGCGLVRAAEPLTMDAALARIVEHHPSLRALELQRDVFEAARDEATLSPALSAFADVENAAGTGGHSGVKAVELTLGLEGVLERGGKRAMRELLAASRLDALAPRRAAAALDLLAEGALRYLDVVAADAEIALATDEARDRERWARLARDRQQAGAISATSPLIAEAKAARVRFDVQRARDRRALAWQRLALQWGERTAEPRDLAPIDAIDLPEPPTLDELAAALERNPELARFAVDERVGRAQLRLAEAARRPDLTWRAGLRRLEDTDDWAFIAGVSVPLDARARSEPGERVARAELESLGVERDASERRLLSLLVEARSMYLSALWEVRALRDDVLPRYDLAAEAAERAWRAGALSPVEGADVLDERLAARQSLLAAAIAARRALIEMQRLTAEPLRRLPAAGERR